MSLVHRPGYLLSVSPWILYVLNPIPDKPDRENARSLTSKKDIACINKLKCLKGNKLPKLSRLVYVVEVILFYML